MDKIKQIRQAVNSELHNYKTNPNHYESQAAEEASNEITEMLESHFGYAIEEDEKAVEYMLKATPEEALIYIRDVIMLPFEKEVSYE